MARLGENRYGKSRVRLSRITRHGDHHEFNEWTVQVLLHGDFETSFTAADNSKILPTDTMKNAVYALARRKPITSVEQFAQDLARHFLAGVPHLTQARIEIKEVPWSRIGESPAAFVQTGLERRTVSFTATRESEMCRSGICDLQILKTTDSAFT